MSNPLSDFMSEVDASALSSTSSSSTSASTTADVAPITAAAPTKSGKLVVCCSVDWENMGSKSQQSGADSSDLVLEGPHQVELACGPVQKMFSSSTAHHTFILAASGELLAWGQNTDGQCGVVPGASTSTIHWPMVIATPSPVKKIACGRHHSLMLCTDGRVFAAGSNTSGQLGIGALPKGAKFMSRFVQVDKLEQAMDISCGESHSLACCMPAGQLYSWGHPLNGQLGTGSKGEFIKDGGKGAALQYHFVWTPQAIYRYVSKDAHGKILTDHSSMRIRQVAAGKNHSVVLEDWENGGLGRVFSCGFGGYGRLGHNGVGDEILFTEVGFFSQFTRDPATGQSIQTSPTNPQRQVRRIDCGSTLSVAVSAIGTAFNWGKLSNSKSGEAMVYPKLCDSGGGLQADPQLLANGSNLVVVGFGPDMVAWGVPVAGKLGLDGDAKSSVAPKYISALSDIKCIDVSAGFGHVAFVCTESSALAALPVLKKRAGSTVTASSTDRGAASKEGEGPSKKKKTK